MKSEHFSNILIVNDKCQMLTYRKHNKILRIFFLQDCAWHLSLKQSDFFGPKMKFIWFWNGKYCDTELFQRACEEEKGKNYLKCPEWRLLVSMHLFVICVLGVEIDILL